MRGGIFILIAAVSLSLILTGCTYCHTTQPEDAKMLSYPTQPYRVVGEVHSKSWAPMLFYCIKLWPASGDRASAKSLAAARENGADAVKGGELYVETHMAIVCILGWVEYHFSGEAIQFEKDGKS